MLSSALRPSSSLEARDWRYATRVDQLNVLKGRLPKPQQTAMGTYAADRQVSPKHMMDCFSTAPAYWHIPMPKN